MKTIKIFLILLISMVCKAQNSLVPINEHNGLFDEPNAYYFDSESEFNKFAGTWKCENGLSSITITLQKKQNIFIPESNNSFDLLIGEYEYIDDTGVTVINTLPNLLDNTIQPYQRNIWGYSLSMPRAGNPFTPNNSPTNIEYRRLRLRIQDPLRPYHNELLKIRYIDEVVPKIEIQIASRGMQILEEGQLPDSRCPTGYFTLTKQP